MARSSGAGGGINSNKLVTKPQPKTEPLAKAITPGRADMQGQALTFNPGPLYSGKGFNSTKAGQPNSMVSGPGGGRVLYGQGGTQGTHGAVNRGEGPNNPPRDILSEFGPEKTPR
jgi:hypothetical protein